MKLLSYKITDTKTPQIGVLENQSIYNLNTLFGDVSLIDIFQMEGYIEKIKHYISSTNITKHNINNILRTKSAPPPKKVGTGVVPHGFGAFIFL